MNGMSYEIGKRLESIKEKILNKYNIIFRDTDEENECFTAGNEIFVGRYKNEEYKLISIFHELGHLLIHQNIINRFRYNTLLIELEWWNIGVREALNMDILFSDDAIFFGYKKALSYAGHDEREYSNWFTNYGIKLWKNLTML